MLIEDIKAAALSARKQGHTLDGTLLQTLYAEAVMVGKNDGNRSVTDDETRAVIRKFLKGATETLAILEKGGDMARSNKTRREIEVLSAFLPASVPVETLASAINDILLRADVAKNVGAVLKELKSVLAGKEYDGKQAAALAKAALAQGTL